METTIRAATPDDAPAIARVHVESWRTTYRGIVPDEYLERMSVEPRERFWASMMSEPGGAGTVYVAESSGGEVIGFAAGGPERSGRPGYTAELYAIYLLQQHQRGGIGRRLTLEVIKTLIAGGHESMLVWVLSDNLSWRFYDRIGGIAIAEKQETIGQKSLREVAFGWSNLGQLHKHLTDDTASNRARHR